MNLSQCALPSFLLEPASENGFGANLAFVINLFSFLCHVVLCDLLLSLLSQMHCQLASNCLPQKTHLATTTTAKDGHAAAREDEALAQCSVGGTGETFVPEPVEENITTDLINGLRRFQTQQDGKRVSNCKGTMEVCKANRDRKPHDHNRNQGNNWFCKKPGSPSQQCTMIPRSK